MTNKSYVLDDEYFNIAYERLNSIKESKDA